MEAFKNTSMMIILAGIFYGAYQMLVSEPPNWRKEGSAAPELLLSADDPALHAGASQPVMPAPLGVGAAGFSAGMTGENRDALAASPTLPVAMDAAPARHLTAPPTPDLPPRGLPSPAWTSESPAGSLPAGPSQAVPSAASAGQPIAPWDPGGPAAVASVGYTAPAGLTDSSTSQPASPAPSLDATVMDRQSLPAPAISAGPSSTAGLGSRPNLLPIQPTSSATVDPQMEMTQGLRLAMEAAGTDIQSGDWAKALRDLSAWYQQPLAAEDREHLVDWLDRLAGEVIYSTQDTLAAGHVVGAGETLASIAARYQMPARLLARINQFPESVLEETPLQPGVELKVVPGPFAAEARMSTGYLTMFAGGLYAGRFRFVTGDSAPDDLIEEPISYVSTQGIPAQEEQRRHEPMAASNPFGRFCLVVGQTAVLHSPGGNPNGSCLQFSEQDMQDLLILLPRGTTVRIVR